MAGTPDDPFASGSLDHLLSYDDPLDDDVDETDVDDVGDIAAQTDWLRSAAEIAAEITGTTHIRFDIARGSVLGFDADLARTILRYPDYRAELRRQWSSDGVPERIREIAALDDELGGLHAELIAQCGDDAGDRGDKVAADAPEAMPDNVIVGPWVLSPRLPTTRAAASREVATPVFREAKADWGLELAVSVTDDGVALLDLRVDPEVAAPLHIVRIDLGGDPHFLVLRKYRGALAGSTEADGEKAWGMGSVEVYPPLAAAALPASWVPLLGPVVARASTPELNLWRRVRAAVDSGDPVARAIDETLR